MWTGGSRGEPWFVDDMIVVGCARLLGGLFERMVRMFGLVGFFFFGSGHWRAVWRHCRMGGMQCCCLGVPRCQLPSARGLVRFVVTSDGASGAARH